MVLARIGMYQVTRFLTDIGIILQGPRHGRGRYMKCLGYVFDGDLGFVHSFESFADKDKGFTTIRIQK